MTHNNPSLIIHNCLSILHQLFSIAILVSTLSLCVWLSCNPSHSTKCHCGGCGTLLLSIVVIAWYCWWCVCLKHHCDSINTTVIGQWMVGSGCHMPSLNPTPIHFTTHTTLLTLWNHLPFPHFHFQKLLLPSLQSTLIHNINHLPFVITLISQPHNTWLNASGMIVTHLCHTSNTNTLSGHSHHQHSKCLCWCLF